MPTYQLRYQRLERFYAFVEIEAATPEEAVERLKNEGPRGFDLEIDRDEPIGEEDDLYDAPIEFFNNPPGEWELISNY